MTNLEIAIIGASYSDAIQNEEFCNLQLRVLDDDSFNREETVIIRNHHQMSAENLSDIMKDLQVPAEKIKYYRQVGRDFGQKSFNRMYASHLK